MVDSSGYGEYEIDGGVTALGDINIIYIIVYGYVIGIGYGSTFNWWLVYL